LAKVSEENVVQDAKDLGVLLAQVVSQENARVSRGGYSPQQLVFGKGARVPESLCEEDATNDMGLQERLEPSPDEDTAAAAIRKACFLRDEARKLLIYSDSKERLKRAIKAPEHKARDFFRGQCVYVWRRAQKRAHRKPGAPLRDRWCGPGIVILSEPGVVWVAIQHRVWRCSPEQVRNATQAEALGAELISQELLRQALTAVKGTTKSSNNTAVDVSDEVPRPETPADAPDDPIDRTEREALELHREQALRSAEAAVKTEPGVPAMARTIDPPPGLLWSPASREGMARSPAGSRIEGLERSPQPDRSGDEVKKRRLFEERVRTWPRP
jgi:hypothetical protein